LDRLGLEMDRLDVALDRLRMKEVHLETKTARPGFTNDRLVVKKVHPGIADLRRSAKRVRTARRPAVRTIAPGRLVPFIVSFTLLSGLAVLIPGFRTKNRHRPRK
jgi:hypothetical protein